jgi:hypothetical protein
LLIGMSSWSGLSHVSTGIGSAYLTPSAVIERVLCLGEQLSGFDYRHNGCAPGAHNVGLIAHADTFTWAPMKFGGPDILRHAYRPAKANLGAPGSDDVTCATIEAAGLDDRLAGIGKAVA